MAQSGIGTDSVVFILLLGLFSPVEKILVFSWLCMCMFRSQKSWMYFADLFMKTFTIDIWQGKGQPSPFIFKKAENN